MEQNKGFSLIELIVVIALITVLMSVGILQMRMVRGYYAKQCAEEVEAQLNKVQITNMARKATELVIYKNVTDNEYYAKIIENKGTALEKFTERKLGRSSLEITYSMDSKDTDIRTLDGTAPITIVFDRATGELKRMDGTNAIGCHRIWIKQRGNDQKVYTITIYQETGKIEVDSDEVKTMNEVVSTEVVPSTEGE